MPLGSFPYAGLVVLLRRELVLEEDAGTRALMRRLGPARRRGWLSRAEFLAMCRWKSPRALRHYRRNSPARIRAVTRAALAARRERRRIELLTALRGVNVPVASAILTLLRPRHYGVLDIRAWQLLYRLGAVTSRPDGRGFGASHWIEYLETLRRHARALGVSARAVEYTLFHCHRKYQAGRLYQDGGRRRARARRRP